MTKAQDRAFQTLWNAALAAGNAAGAAAKPTPMIVNYLANPLDDNSVVKQEFIADGMCGFAWLAFRGRNPFINWMRRNRIGSKDYPSGWSYWIGAFNQSIDRKEKAARAMAETLRAAVPDLKVYAQSRLD